MTGTVKKVGLSATAIAAIIGTTVTFTPTWEGMDKVAKRDPIGTGHPITYCYGQTAEYGRVKIGTRFTKVECDQKLAESLPHYLALLEPYVTVPLPTKTYSSLLDAAYNAGPTAVGESPMVRKMNAGDLRGGCNAFTGWYTTTKNNGIRKEVPGLIARRSGRKGDPRKTERDLCLEGVREGLAKPAPASVKAVAPKKHWWQF